MTFCGLRYRHETAQRFIYQAHQIPVYATGRTITYQDCKLWSSFNHFLTHVILVRVAYGSNGHETSQLRLRDSFTDACLIVEAACGFHRPSTVITSPSAVCCTTALSSQNAPGIDSKRELAADDASTERPAYCHTKRELAAHGANTEKATYRHNNDNGIIHDRCSVKGLRHSDLDLTAPPFAESTHVTPPTITIAADAAVLGVRHCHGVVGLRGHKPQFLAHVLQHHASAHRLVAGHIWQSQSICVKPLAQAALRIAALPLAQPARYSPSGLCDPRDNRLCTCGHAVLSRGAREARLQNMAAAAMATAADLTALTNPTASAPFARCTKPCSRTTIPHFA